jgi:hypothetical protein
MYPLGQLGGETLVDLRARVSDAAAEFESLTALIRNNFARRTGEPSELPPVLPPAAGRAISGQSEIIADAHYYQSHPVFGWDGSGDEVCSSYIYSTVVKGKSGGWVAYKLLTAVLMIEETFADALAAASVEVKGGGGIWGWANMDVKLPEAASLAETMRIFTNLASKILDIGKGDLSTCDELIANDLIQLYHRNEIAKLID